MSEERISSALANALENLYQCFAPYQLAAHVEGCPCCVSPDEAKALARVPLRDATGQELLSFSFSALTTWGTEVDLKHFLYRCPNCFRKIAVHAVAPLARSGTKSH
jgi:hypothetical protein